MSNEAAVAAPPPAAAPTSSPAPEGVPPAAPEAPKAGEATAAAVAKEIQRLKVKQKIDGKEVEKEVPLDEVLSTYGQVDQIRAAANKRFQEAAELQKKLQLAVENGKKDPDAALRELFGIEDPYEYHERKVAEKYRAELLQKEDPKAYELWKKEQAVAEREAKLAEQERQYQEQQQAVMHQQQVEHTYTTIDTALQKSGLPRDGETIALMADIALLNLDHGIDLSSDEIAQAAKDRLDGYTNRAKQRFETLEGDALLSELSPAVVEKVRKALLAKAKAVATKPVQAPPPPQEPEPTDKKASKYQSDSAILRRIMRD